MSKRDTLSGWCYLSFVSDETGDFLGAAIIKARKLEDAVQIAWEMNINPGGQVAGMKLKTAYLPKEMFRNRLLTREENRLAFPGGVYSTRERRVTYAVN